MLAFAIERSDWASVAATGDVEIEGLAPCLGLFGADTGAEVEGARTSG